MPHVVRWLQVKEWEVHVQRPSGCAKESGYQEDWRPHESALENAGAEGLVGSMAGVTGRFPEVM